MKWMTVAATSLMGGLVGWTMGGHLVSKGTGAFLALILGLAGAVYGFTVTRHDT